MATLFSLTKRNLLMFFRSKSEVFFAFLGVFIIIGLYLLFLTDMQVKGIEESLGKVDGISAMVSSWITAGLIAVSTVTFTLGGLGRIVSDREKNAFNDFLVAPLNRNTVFMSYIFSALIIALSLSGVLLILAELYILSTGGTLLSFIQLLKVIGITGLCVFSSSLLMLFIVSFLKNEQAMSLMASMVGTLIGFITGAYIPFGYMPKGIQMFATLFPPTQGASLLRKVFLDSPAKEVFQNNIEPLKEYYKTQGVNLYFGNTELSSTFMIIFLIGSIILFAILNIIRFKKMKNY